MSNVAIVEKGKVVYRGALPKSWKNSSGLYHSRDDWTVLNPMGIFPLEEVTPTFDDTQMLDGFVEDIQTDKVVLTWNVRSKTTEEIAEEAQAQAQAYISLRQRAYPSLEDQADMAYWDRQDGTTTLDDAITAVKSAYPKT